MDYRPPVALPQAPRPDTPVPPEPLSVFPEAQADPPMFAHETTGFRPFQGKGNRLGNS